MESTSTAAPALTRARQLFFDEGADPGGMLAPHVGRSWQRCGMLDTRQGAPEPLARSELASRRDAAQWLMRCAQPELDGLAEHVLGPGCVVILSDADGLILDEVGSPEFLPKAQRVALAPGVDWSEARRGTNAIGTALVEREALMVLGGEHFLELNAALGCAAAPILTPRGELAGVLDISGESVHVDVHALGLVRMAAAQVEHRMMLSSGAGQMVRFHRRPALLGTAREGLIAVDGGRIVGVNRTALALLGAGWDDLLNERADRVFGTRWQKLQQAPGLFAAPGGQQWAVAVDRLRETAPAPAARAAPAPPADAVEPLLERAARVLGEGLAVLVHGETGSGKEVFARRLHGASRRAGGPFVAVNCAALPETLIEAELFGYEEGAFTGARRRGQPGRLREADGGVLFLDEIGDMPLALQPRLLRALEERVVRPLGAAHDKAVDFDLVCATHHDLQQRVAEGRFREDLLYRLRGYTVTIPPLRERADRRALIERLFDDAGGARKRLRLEAAALDALDRQRWPGNLRELISVLKGLVALAEPESRIGLADLQGLVTLDAAASEPPPPADGSLATLARGAIEQALAAHGGRVAAAARSLGLHRATLYRHLARRRPPP